MSHRVIIIEGNSLALPHGDTLAEKQQIFAALSTLLKIEILKAGYTFTLGEAFRSDEQAAIHALGPSGRKELAALVVNRFPDLAVKIANNTGSGIARSLHTLKLAVDLNLFRDGKFLTSSLDHQRFGEWWEKQDPLCRWGGRWGDGNHYSIEHGGVK